MPLCGRKKNGLLITGHTRTDVRAEELMAGLDLVISTPPTSPSVPHRLSIDQGSRFHDSGYKFPPCPQGHNHTQDTIRHTLFAPLSTPFSRKTQDKTQKPRAQQAMGCRAVALLLVTLAVAVALPSSSSAAGGRGAKTRSSTGAISIEGIDEAVFFPFPAQDQDEDPTGTESITSKLMSAGAPSRESSFTPKAYPAKWSHKRDHTPPLGDFAAQQIFTPEAYPVKWNAKRYPSPPLSGDFVAQRSSFTSEAYPVKWSGKRYFSPPFGDFATQRSSFTSEAYPVKWNGKRYPISPPQGIMKQ